MSNRENKDNEELMMQDEMEKCLIDVETCLEYTYGMWNKFDFPKLTIAERKEIPETIARVYKGDYVSELAAACQCFFLFRKAHEYAEGEAAGAVLLGDYLFSRFSHYLIPIDSTRLIDEFASLLKLEILEEMKGRNGFDMENYINFLYKIPSFIAE